MRCLISIALILSSCGGSGGADFLIVSEFFDGDYSITGTITLPAEVSDKSAVLTVAKVSGTGSGSELIQKRVTGDSFTYKISNLSAGSYTVRMQVDVDGNGSSNNEGDYEGYCCGTLDAPIVETDEAAEIIITNASVSAKNFGLKEKN